MKNLRKLGSLLFVFGLFVIIFLGLPWYVVVADDPAAPWWLKLAVFAFLGGVFIVLAALAVEQSTQTKQGDAAAISSADQSILLMSAHHIADREIEASLGLVQGHTVFAIWLGNDLSALIRLILGGELTEYTEMMGNARKTALTRMVSEAKEMGADAVINIRYTTTSVIGSAAELLVYGTAVKLRKE